MISEAAQRKLRILIFWEKYGLEATIDAYEVKKRTLYDWKKKLRTGDGKPEVLNDKSRAPKRKRKRTWHPDIMEEVRRIRTMHPNLGKEKVFIHLQAFCRKENLMCPKSRTIGRLIADAPDKMRTFPIKVRHDGTVILKKRWQILRKPKKLKAENPGHCIALDTI